MTGIESNMSKGVVGILTVAALAVGIVVGVALEKSGTSTAKPVTAQNEKIPVAISTQTARTEAKPAKEPAASSHSVFGNWDPFQEMRDMQAEMDQMFQRSITRFQMNPQMSIFKDEAGYSSSLDVRELKDRYEVRAYLPDAKVSDAKVNLNDNRLTVEISNQSAEKQTGKQGSASTQEWGQYEQMVQLAGNLKPDQMKIERKEHELLITIPKVTS